MFLGSVNKPIAKSIHLKHYSFLFFTITATFLVGNWGQITSVDLILWVVSLHFISGMASLKEYFHFCQERPLSECCGSITMLRSLKTVHISYWPPLATYTLLPCSTPRQSLLESMCVRHTMNLGTQTHFVSLKWEVYVLSYFQYLNENYHSFNHVML